MKMKFSMVIIVALGILAAAAAAVLVRAFMVPAPRTAGPQQPVETQVLVALQALPAMTVVESLAVVAKKVPVASAPKGALKDPVQVVGKVLIMPVVAGEAFTEASFAREGAGVNLATALPSGKRAVSVTLNDATGMVGLLYPGSVVDVMVSVQAGSRQGGEGETINRTVVQGVQVLAVGQESVASEPAKSAVGGAASNKGDARMVTLLVEPKQAQLLQLAAQKGSVCLAMRNPLDKAPVTLQVTRMRELSGASEEPSLDALAAAAVKNAAEAWQANMNARPVVVADADGGAKPTTQPAAPVPMWETLIIRGAKSEVRTFPMPEKKVREVSEVRG